MGWTEERAGARGQVPLPLRLLRDASARAATSSSSSSSPSPANSGLLNQRSVLLSCSRPPTRVRGMVLLLRPLPAPPSPKLGCTSAQLLLLHQKRISTSSPPRREIVLIIAVAVVVATRGVAASLVFIETLELIGGDSPAERKGVSRHACKAGYSSVDSNSNPLSPSHVPTHLASCSAVSSGVSIAAIRVARFFFFDIGPSSSASRSVATARRSDLALYSAYISSNSASSRSTYPPCAKCRSGCMGRGWNRMRPCWGCIGRSWNRMPPCWGYMGRGWNRMPPCWGCIGRGWNRMPRARLVWV